MEIPYKALTSSAKAAEAVSGLNSGLYLGNCPSHITEWKTKEVKWVSLLMPLRRPAPSLSPKGVSVLLCAGEGCIEPIGEIHPKVTSITIFPKKYFPSSDDDNETSKTKHFFNGISSFTACIFSFIFFCKGI